MDTYILDTNLFFNFEPGMGLGNKTEEVVKVMTKIGMLFKQKKTNSFVMSPRIVDEFMSFFDNKNQSFLQEFLSVVTIQSPDLHQAEIPAHAIANLVDETRQRNQRGMTVAEEEMQTIAKNFIGFSATDRVAFQKKIGESVRHFRERFRQATRVGFIDSLADLDNVLLARQLNGVLITTDEGLLRWAREFGAKEMPAAVFGQQMLTYLHHQE